MAVPSVSGVLTPAQVRATGAAIVGMQEPDGALPWFPGGKTDPWDHVESAMALSASGYLDAARAAYEWSAHTQRDDGSWPMELRAGRVVDPGVDSNFCAYIAVGVWHHYLITGDEAFLWSMWPTVRAALDRVLMFQRGDGAFRWAADYRTGAMFDDALRTGNSSIYSALCCGLRIAGEVGADAGTWERARGDLAVAFTRPDEVFVPAGEHSMDWYYPVLGGPLRGDSGRAQIDAEWERFVVPGLGARCVDHRPWVTGAETSELALALEALGDVDRAAAMVESIQHLRDPDGSYWTGLVFADGKRWPVERSCWTSAAVILAADAISRATPAGGIFAELDDDRLAADEPVAQRR
ncbi:prenyltransferase [Gordonia sihwensis]|uniref:prenyltransferase n=1 Tax=Gordonia sihwensis TaxID=173559 RepID=UPI0005F0588A|nr:prenyltransferase [Gordonia sihwensis]KJR10174.1 prenyltransferase [Gordonia sihwensis]